MFAWYRNSRICYVYLADVEDPYNVAGHLGNNVQRELSWIPSSSVQHRETLLKSFAYSRWFTRGWTLQELLAPWCLRFYTQQWTPIYMDEPEPYSTSPDPLKMSQNKLLKFVSNVTGIRFDVLRNPTSMSNCSNGEKMSWMTGRKTTRTEDAAYCLLGIFDINMPLLYGEGSKAFERLQGEIIKQSTDHSLFAWQWPQGLSTTKGKHPNVFAASTMPFSNLNSNVLNDRIGVIEDAGEIGTEEDDPLSAVISLTNFGLSMNLELIPTADPNYVFGALNLERGRFQNLPVIPGRELWCIPLQKVGRVYHRAPFPPGPFPIQTRRQRVLHPIHIPRDQQYFSLFADYRYHCAFLILFPELEIGAGLKIESLGQTGDATLSPHRSTIVIPWEAMQSGEIVSSILRMKRRDGFCFKLYVGAREVNGEVQTAVKLFEASTASETIAKIDMTFHPSSRYRDEYGALSLMVNEGHRFDPLPSDAYHGIIFSISLYMEETPHMLESDRIAESEG